MAGGIILFGIGRANSMNEIKNIFSLINKNLIEAYSASADFQLNADSDQDIVTSGRNKFTNQFASSIKTIKDTLFYLENSTILSHSSEFKAAKDTFLMALKNYETTFNYLVLGYKEIGMKNAGNINSAQSISDQLPKLNVASRISGFAEMVGNIKKYESDLLSNFDLRAYNYLMQEIDNIRNNAMMLSLSTEDNDALMQVLDSYSQKINNLHEQIKIIDPKGTQGLSSELQADYELLLKQYNALKSGFIKSAQTIRIVWISIMMFILLLTVIAYILLLLKLREEVHKPLHQFVDYSYNLSKGKLLSSDEFTDAKYEFKKLGENLIKINNSLKEKKKFIDGLLKQKFDIDVALQGKNDTFGKTLIALKENLRKTRDEQLQHAEQNQLRRYLNEGIAKFAEILRTNSDDLSRLSDIFIRELVRYLEAIQGGLFLLKENDESRLYLASAFAYNRKRYLNKEILIGEGLVGTCAIEMKSINLTEIPEDYIEITSGLGDTPPSNILLLPVMFERTLIGVIEIASMKKFQAHQIEAGEKISESLASTIITARINTRTSELLKKSQEQAAEMAEQEEEMRQNMEELKATQEESARREDELEAILNALNDSFYLFEYDPEGIIINANKKVLLLLNRTYDQVVGKSHSEIFEVESSANSAMFSKVIDGETIEITENVLINKKEMLIKNTFSPVQSKEKKVVKVLNIFTIISKS